MELILKTYVDDQDGSFVAERCFIDNVEISEEQYDSIIEDVYNDFNDEFDPCADCQCADCCEEEFDYEDLLDVFVDKILDAQGCPSCTKDILDEFANIFISNEEEDEEEYGDEVVEQVVYNNIYIPNITNSNKLIEILKDLIR